MRKFHFVDFAAHYQKGFRNHVTSITEIPERVRSFKHYGCYATYFFFSDEILTYLGTEHEEGSKPSLAGYEGKVWAPYLPIDIDHKDFAVAREATQFFLSFFLHQWQIDPNGLQVYFSGQKGFHLMLDTRLFGKTVGSKSLPQVFSAMRHHLTWELPEYLREAVDLSIKDRLRLWRLPNTIHEKSGLYKILVSEEELLKTPADEIKILAKKMRPLEKTDETGFLSHVPVRSNRNASQLYRRVQRQIKRMTQKPFQYHFRHPKNLSRLTFPCAGIQKIWEGNVESGYRNNCAIRLASEFRLLGLNESEIHEKLSEWNEKNSVKLPPHELESVIRSAYQHRFPYRYGCHDEVLRHFCSLESYEACKAHTANP